MYELDESQAFEAMTLFLTAFYQRTNGAAGVVALLGIAVAVAVAAHSVPHCGAWPPAGVLSTHLMEGIRCAP